MDSLKIASRPWAKTMENPFGFTTVFTHFFTLTTAFERVRKTADRSRIQTASLSKFKSVITGNKIFKCNQGQGSRSDRAAAWPLR